jgi:hypothetical protein
MITLPLGYNPDLDKILKQGQIQFTEQYQLIRISQGNEWRSVTWRDVEYAKYNWAYPFANALIIGIIRL